MNTIRTWRLHRRCGKTEWGQNRMGLGKLKERQEMMEKFEAAVTVLSVFASVAVAAGVTGSAESWDLTTVRRQADRAADWQLAHPVTTGRFVEQHTPLYWTMGAFYNGLLDWGLANPGSRRVVDHVRRIGEEVGWDRQRLPRLVIGHADTHCVCSAWLQLAAEDAVLPGRIRATRECFDALRADRTEYPIDFDRKNPLARMRWTWADALYMSPPSWVLLAGLTGDRGYLDHMTKEFKATTAKLFSEKVRLYYRDSTYLPGGQNWKGRDVFWGRGNGWVFGAFAMILRDMPADYPERAWFVSRFRAMAEGVAACQQADGSWHPDLADAKSPDCPEMSGTSFFTYGFLWGMNNGLLDPAVYEPVVRRAWSAICRAMDGEGRLGWVQQVGSSPTAELQADYFEFYATGAYLCAAKELCTWIVRTSHPKCASVVVTGGKTYEPNRAVRFKKGVVSPGGRVWDVRYGREVAGAVDANGDFVFKINILAGQRREFLVLAKPLLGRAGSRGRLLSARSVESAGRLVRGGSTAR